MNSEQCSILVVDDVEANRDLLARRLQRQGHRVELAEDGRQALELIKTEPFDLILLDIMMPEMNGYEVLETLKADPDLAHIPVVMISALSEIESIVKCIELGADDYLFKPFNHTILKARVNASLEKKRLRDQEKAYFKQLEIEKEKSERLLLSILPKSIAERLKQGEVTIADSFTEVTVLFADIVGFTKIAALLSPSELINLLNEVFSAFDQLAEKNGLEKIKTVGDAYIAVGGLPIPLVNHAAASAEMALEMQQTIAQFKEVENGKPLSLRIGIHSGPVAAGVIGTKKFIYDLWGDTVNIASRMESQGSPGCIQISATTYGYLHDKYLFQERGEIDIKGRGNMTTYWLTGRK